MFLYIYIYTVYIIHTVKHLYDGCILDSELFLYNLVICIWKYIINYNFIYTSCVQLSKITSIKHIFRINNKYIYYLCEL